MGIRRGFGTGLVALLVMLGGICWAQEGEDVGASMEETTSPAVSYTLPEEEEVQESTEVQTTEEDPLIARLKAEQAESGTALGDVNQPDTYSPGLEFLRLLAIVLFMCGLIVMAVYLNRKYGGKGGVFAGQGLGKIIGQMRISPKASLVFVQTGGRVLVLGLTQQQVNLVSEFDADAFEAMNQSEVVTEENAPKVTEFLEQLKQRQSEMQSAGKMSSPSPTLERPVDDELESLRGDIERLQEFLKESGGNKGAE